MWKRERLLAPHISCIILCNILLKDNCKTCKEEKCIRIADQVSRGKYACIHTYAYIYIRIIN